MFLQFNGYSLAGSIPDKSGVARREQLGFEKTGDLMELFAAEREFMAYGPSHLVVLVIFAVGAALLVWGGRRLTESQARLFGRAFAVVIVASFLVALTYKLINRDLQTSIPLQLCDVANSLRPSLYGHNGIGHSC